MTVGVAERYFFEHTDPELAAIVRTAVDALVDAGARLVEIDMHWPVEGMAGESRGLGKVYKDVRRAWYVVSDRAGALRKRGELYASGAPPRDPDLS